MEKNIGNVGTYTDEIDEQEMDRRMTTKDKSVKGFIKRNWKKAAVGVGLFVLGVVAAKSTAQRDEIEYATPIECEFEEEPTE